MICRGTHAAPTLEPVWGPSHNIFTMFRSRCVGFQPLAALRLDPRPAHSTLPPHVAATAFAPASGVALVAALSIAAGAARADRQAISALHDGRVAEKRGVETPRNDNEIS
jgi:hypothetical protein